MNQELKEKEKIFEEWRDSLEFDKQTLYEYLDTIKSYIDFAEHYRSRIFANDTGRSEQLLAYVEGYVKEFEETGTTGWEQYEKAKELLKSL